VTDVTYFCDSRDKFAIKTIIKTIVILNSSV